MGEGKEEEASATSAGLLHVDQLIAEAHDLGILFLTHVRQEVEQGLLVVS
jgi:hypothetical protein